MNLPIPDNNAVKKAVKWISSEMKADPVLKRIDLVYKASIRFDLSPLETEYLLSAEAFKNVQDNNIT